MCMSKPTPPPQPKAPPPPPSQRDANLDGVRNRQARAAAQGGMEDAQTGAGLGPQGPTASPVLGT